MTYTIEIILKNIKHSNNDDIKNYLYDLAYGFNCIDEYFNYELEGIGHLIKKNICVYTINFNSEDIDNFIKFITFIKCIKGIYIDTIYHDDIKCNIIYKHDRYYKNNINLINNKDYQRIVKVL